MGDSVARVVIAAVSGSAASTLAGAVLWGSEARRFWLFVAGAFIVQFSVTFLVTRGRAVNR